MSSWTYPTSTLWMHYLDVFNLLGPMPINGSPYDADCAIALSFGRNNISDDHLLDVHTCFRSSDSVMAAITNINRSHGDNVNGFHAGIPNHDIAMKVIQVIKWSAETRIPVMAQWEVAMAICQQ